MFVPGTMRLFDENVGRSRRRGSYLLQTGLVALTLFVLLAVEGVVIPGAVIVTIASTAFIVFAIPHSVASQTRRVGGGHIVGVLAGAAFVGIAAIPGLDGAIDQSRLLWALVACVAVGLATFVMVVTDTEHPPRRDVPRAGAGRLELVVRGLHPDRRCELFHHPPSPAGPPDQPDLGPRSIRIGAPSARSRRLATGPLPQAGSAELGGRPELVRGDFPRPPLKRPADPGSAEGSAVPGGGRAIFRPTLGWRHLWRLG